MDDDLPGWVPFVLAPVAVLAGLWGLWCTIIGFVGGTMPIIGYETDGSLLLGAFMLFIGEPLLLTVAWWATFLVVWPLVLLTNLFSKSSREPT